MTLAHRQLHRRLWLTLAVLLPLLVLAGLLARRPMPTMSGETSLPPDHAPNPPHP